VKNRSYLPEALLILATALWGLSFILVKEAIEHTGPFTFLAWRFLFAMPFLMAWKTREQIAGISRRSFQAGLIMGFTLCGAYTLQTLSLKFTAATNTSLLTGIYVILVPFLAIFFLKERPHPSSYLGVFLSTLGIISMAGDLTSWKGLGDLLAIVSTLFIALQIIEIHAWTVKFSAPLMVTLPIGTLTLFCWICALLFEKPFDLPSSSSFWMALFITSFFATFVCFIIQAYTQKKTTATVATIIYTTEPVWGALFANWIGGEPLTKEIFVGGSLLTAGMIAVQFPILKNAIPQLAAFVRKL